MDIIDDRVRRDTFCRVRESGEWAPVIEFYDDDGLAGVAAVMSGDQMKLARGLLAWVISDATRCVLVQDVRLWQDIEPPTEAMMVTFLDDLGIRVVMHDYIIDGGGVQFDDPQEFRRFQAGHQLGLLQRAMEIRRILAGTTPLDEQLVLLAKVPQFEVRRF